ncbi:type IV toxin-antitoxin system AbiEi family antitoxin [Sanguibacter gelidistatuariae]|uniref:type IV toxin-antitoxin system AbiEi family antitoxin n=1 Tax=Sanguibacter gelidistatuariae TaxID=1814289 RepID=UPI001587FDB3|nr:type IV toxin-antitoxin system AbiEi family antitoxin [Sanguibacter gelidistatuariae]
MSAARMHNALPRAINRAWVAAPRTHRPVELSDGGAVQFATRRGLDNLDVEKISTDLGTVTVTTVEQTILDLMRGLGADGMEGEIEPVVRALADRTDLTRVLRLATEDKGSRAALDRFMNVLA